MTTFKDIFGSIGDILDQKVEESNKKNEEEIKTQKEFEESRRKTNSITIEEEELEIKTEALIRTLRDGIKNREYDFLSDKVKTSNIDVKKMDNLILHNAYARACLFVGENESAYKSFLKLDSNNPRIHSIMGLISYANQSYEKARQHISNSNEMIPETRLVIANCEYGSERIDWQHFEKLLLPIINSSKDANHFLGMLHYSRQHYSKAFDFFSSAVEKDLTCSDSRLNQIKSWYALSKEIDQNLISAYYHFTDSSIAPEKLETEVRNQRVNFERYKPKDNLYYLLKEENK